MIKVLIKIIKDNKEMLALIIGLALVALFFRLLPERVTAPKYHIVELSQNNIKIDQK